MPFTPNPKPFMNGILLEDPSKFGTPDQLVDPIAAAIADDIAAKAASRGGKTLLMERYSQAEQYSFGEIPKCVTPERLDTPDKTASHALYIQTFGRVERKEDRAFVQLAIIEASIALFQLTENTPNQKVQRDKIKRFLAARLRIAGCPDVTETISRVVRGVRNV